MNFLLPRARLCEIIDVVILFVQEWRLGVPEALKYYLSHRCCELPVKVFAQRYIVCFYAKLQRLLGKLFLLFFNSTDCFVYHLLKCRKFRRSEEHTSELQSRQYLV